MFVHLHSYRLHSYHYDAASLSTSSTSQLRANSSPSHPSCLYNHFPLPIFSDFAFLSSSEISMACTSRSCAMAGKPLKYSFLCCFLATNNFFLLHTVGTVLVHAFQLFETHSCCGKSMGKSLNLSNSPLTHQIPVSPFSALLFVCKDTLNNLPTCNKPSWYISLTVKMLTFFFRSFRALSHRPNLSSVCFG